MKLIVFAFLIAFGAAIVKRPISYRIKWYSDTTGEKIKMNFVINFNLSAMLYYKMLHIVIMVDRISYIMYI